MKICKTCDVEKELKLFSKSSNAKDGFKSQCKSCVSLKSKERSSTKEFKENQKNYYNSIPPEVKKERSRKYYENNKEKVSESNKIYREENKEKLSKLNKIYQEENKDSLREKKKLYRSIEENKQSMKKWRKNNTDKIKGYRESYSKSEACKEHRKNWYKSIKKRKPYVLAWRSVLSNTLKRFGKEKEGETIKLLGYSAIELKEHLEILFVDGMSWENHGEWHIDHIKMVCEFDKETPMCVVNALDNLRPLWMEDNCSRKLN
jgi:hypothetical protein